MFTSDGDRHAPARVSLVTGAATSPPGLGAVKALAARGDTVALTYARNEAEANTLAGQLTGASAHKFLLNDPEHGASTLISDVIETHGRLDCLVLNAWQRPSTGPGPEMVPFDESDEWEDIFVTNAVGTLDVLAKALPHLRNSPAGRVVLISSGVLDHPLEHVAPYAAAKAALEATMRTLAWDTRTDGVTFNIVVPGWIVPDPIPPYLAEYVDGHLARTALGKLVTPEQVGAAVAFLTSESGGITGERLGVTAGY